MMLVNITRVFVTEKRTSKLPQIQPERPVCHPDRSRRISCGPAKIFKENASRTSERLTYRISRVPFSPQPIAPKPVHYSAKALPLSVNVSRRA
ncbi:MAG: hypothetical protein ACI85Z_000716 [Rheinheimera aquimaris]|jgi:hypothetical protein